MAFANYLLKVGGREIPYDLIQLNSYKATPDQRQDLDSYRDNTGLLHRNALEHTATKIEFQTVMMPESTKIQLMSLIQSAFISVIERKVEVEYYNPATSQYKTGTFYMPDTEFSLYTVDEDGVLWFDSFRLAFIEY